ncbi:MULTISPECIES: hypothetical protein [unclassified Marinobacter]|uniref:hypothetical protein n=1 Tax=unclassified Marinobacter TaxID=83889 RepID=UPI001927FB94|nr:MULTISPECIES: hypothetical protein [unclassified Marinobacter]MBL3827215.1 hypothetical protein [Marinobacter sp. MC3]MBL3895695.1 hypothetical protein [Marinobacter sp. MW3]
MSDENLCMLRYYKRHVCQLKKMLNDLDPGASDLRPLAEIQGYLIDRVVDIEAKVSKQQALRKSLKSKLREKGTSKAKSSAIKERITSCNARISGYKFLLYLWRCFRDGIANKYVSKWNLKRFFYNHDSSEMKPAPGYIGGKKGIRAERNLLQEALSNNVPALLCDLTNIIRHGDVCLLGATDPFVIEVKSSANRNKRTDRQLLAIKTIHQYLEEDVGSVGGFPGIQRQPLPLKERHHNWAINYVAVEAADGRPSRISPEEGVFYIGVPTQEEVNIEQLFEGVDEPMLFMLNHDKTEQLWGNYYPFTLSLLEPETLYAFLSGTIFLLVVISQSSLRARANASGFDLNVVMANNIGFELFNRASMFNNELPYAASEHFVGRLAFEFLSLDWFFESERLMINDLEEQMNRESESS